MNKSVLFVGSSRAGKSYQSALIAVELGLTLVCCDQLIEEKYLKPHLKLQGFGEGLSEVGRWMGKPGDPQHEEKSRIYRGFEEQVMLSVCSRLRAGEILVVDSTGSVIYIHSEILAILRELCVVVKIDAPPSLAEELFEKYQREDPPIVWAPGTYEPLPGENKESARARCYKTRLLPSREVLYNSLANKHLDYSWLREPGRTAREVLEKIYK